MPFVARSQQYSQQVTEDIVLAETNAEADANRDVNKPLYFGLGCLLTGLPFLTSLVVDDSFTPSAVIGPPLAIFGIYRYRPDPPASKLLGKSPAYINTYTSHYKSKRGKTQAQWAAAGCIAGGGVLGAFLLGFWGGLDASE